MAHTTIKKLAIALCSAMIVFMGCTKIEPDAPKMANNYDSKPQIVKVSEGEKVLRWDYRDLRMQFKNDQLEDSFIPVTVTNKEDKEGTRVAERFDVLAHGIMAQYIEPKTENFSEKEGATTTIAAEELDHQNGWVENRSGKVYSWDATNVDDAKDCPYSYRDSVWTASAVYTFVPDSLAGYKVNFPAVNAVVKAGEKQTEEVNGVAYNGKTWNALKVSYPSTVTFTIPSEYRVSGGQYELKRDIVNIVYYLRHEVKTTLENLTYKVNILDGEKIYKEYQTVDFDLVTRDNGEVKRDGKSSYHLEEEFNIAAAKVEDVEVYSEEALKDTKVDLTKGNITGKTESEDIFKKTTYNGNDKASMTDGRSTDVKIVYESYAWGETELPYASVTGRKAELKSVKNTAETTAAKVVYDVTLTLTYNVAYNNSDKKAEDKVIVINYKRYMKVDNFTKDIENLKYNVNIIDGEKIYKEYQTVDFDLVTRNNGEFATSVPYRLEEEFDITATKVEDVEVYSESALKDTKVDLTKGEIKGTTENEDIFKKTTYNGSDKASMTDGRSTDVKIVYEAYAWNAKNLPYTSVAGRKAELKSVKNTAETTAAKVVYDVTLTLTYNVAYNNSDKKAEDKVIVINYKRYMKVDNYETTVAASDFELAFEQPNEAEMGTSIERNSYREVTTNNGEVVKDSTYTRDIAMGAKLTRTGAARKAVSEVKNLTVSIIPNGGDKTTYGSKDANGIQTMKVSRKYDVLTSDGATYELEIFDEKDIRAGEDFGHHASFVDAGFEPKVALQPTLNASESTETSKVYDVKVSVDMPVNRTDKVATKAAGNDETFTVSASHQETLAVEDEYVSSREVWTVTPNGDGFDVKGELFETYTLTGEKSVDSKSGRMNVSLSGVNGSVKTVKNVSYSTNGNGHNGTGSGTYSDNATNGVSADAFNNEYKWSADGKLTLTLSGKGGKDASKTFEPTFVISEAGQNISNGTDKGDYTSYTYTNKVNGVYSLEGKKVNLSATDTRELRIENPKDEYVSSREVWTVTPNGDGFDVKGELFETYTLTGEKSVDSKSGRMNVSLSGVNGSVKTVKNVSYSTNGNGHNGTGSGTYSDNATNGVSADAFNNEYKWSADGKLTLTLKGKGGKDASKTFEPTFVISEAGQNISNGTDKGDYTSYTYTNKVNGVYSLEGKNVNLSATDTRELRVEKEIETLVGNLIGGGMSVVPAHESNGGFADGSGKQTATMCLTLVKADGSAAAIVYAFESSEMRIPTDSQISGADFVAGSYDSTYDSGVYMNGKWVPAVAKDNSWGISYSIPSQKDIRSIRNESLKQWNWRGGNYSTHLSNYSVKVENGVCSIYYNGEIVKSFR